MAATSRGGGETHQHPLIRSILPLRLRRLHRLPPLPHSYPERRVSEALRLVTGVGYGRTDVIRGYRLARNVRRLA